MRTRSDIALAGLWSLLLCAGLACQRPEATDRAPVYSPVDDRPAPALTDSAPVDLPPIDMPPADPPAAPAALEPETSTPVADPPVDASLPPESTPPAEEPVPEIPPAADSDDDPASNEFPDDAAPQPAPVEPDPVPAEPTEPPVDLNDVRQDYLRRFNAQVEREKQYPPQARRMGRQGRVAMLIQLNAAGELLRLDIVQSSGHLALDEAAKQAVKDAAPFPPPPQPAFDPEPTFQMGLDFQLR